VIRLLRHGVGQRLRIWSDGDWPTDHVPTRGVAIEWVGQVGHPTSYVLLGGSPSDKSGVTVGDYGPVFEDALAGAADVVRLGLLDEYRGAVDEVLANPTDDARPMTISLAAHGEAGSSIVAFRAGTIFLTTIFERVASLDDAELWARWRAALRQAGAFSTRKAEDAAADVRPESEVTHGDRG